MYEVKTALQYSYLKYKESWEQTRTIVYSILQVNSKSKIQLQDVIKFPWEKETTDEDTKITKEDITRLNKMAESYKKYINDGN